MASVNLFLMCCSLKLLQRRYWTQVGSWIMDKMNSHVPTGSYTGGLTMVCESLMTYCSNKDKLSTFWNSGQPHCHSSTGIFKHFWLGEALANSPKAKELSPSPDIVWYYYGVKKVWHWQKSCKAGAMLTGLFEIQQRLNFAPTEVYAPR